MRKALAAGMAALTFGGAVAVSALPGAAEAQRYGYYYGGDHHHHGNDAAAAAIVGGIAGLAIGSALAGSHPYSSGYYGNGYYGNGYYGGYGYAPSYYGSGYYGGGYGYAPAYYGYGYAPVTCVSRRWVWDPYIGRRVLITRHYAC